jgi:hypothetical protein
MHVTGSLKSGPKTCWYTTTFCNLFLLHIQYIFNIITKLLMGRLNHRRLSSINMYDHHTKKHHPMISQTHLDFCIFRLLCTKSVSSRLLACTCERETRSPKQSSSVILQQERVNKVFGKHSMCLLNHFIITACLPYCWACVNHCR